MNRREFLITSSTLALPWQFTFANTTEFKMPVISESQLPVLTEAWKSYLAALDEMRKMLESQPRFDHEDHQAKAYHVMMEIQAMAYNYVIAPRKGHPRVLLNTGWQTDIYTLGSPAPDFLYGIFMADGQQTYRLSGRVGDLKLFMVNTHNGVMGDEGFKFLKNYDMLAFEINEDGTYEVIISAKEHEGNWIKLDPNSSYQFLNVRRALGDWNGDPGEIRVELVDDSSAEDYLHEEFDHAAMAARIRKAEAFVRYILGLWVVGLYDMYMKQSEGQKNVFKPFPGDFTDLASWSSSYALGIYSVQPGEALLVEFEEPIDGQFWSFQLTDVWSRPLPFASRLTSSNMVTAKSDPDGKIRFILSHKDPGYYNWLDTCGWTEGSLIVRNYQGKNDPKIKATIVPLNQLGSVMPSDAVRASAEERSATITGRRLAWQNLLGE
ncbi:MAG: DUF1214 domain-containing protein [Halieaceae bacterium]|nr:DUF1214 domain-containing protein [Halieaceae bacterium]